MCMSVHDEDTSRSKQHSAQVGVDKGIAVVTHWRRGVNREQFSLGDTTKKQTAMTVFKGEKRVVPSSSAINEVWLTSDNLKGET